MPMRFSTTWPAAPEVIGDRFGVCSYCMGGRMSVVVAAACRIIARRGAPTPAVGINSPDSPAAGRPDQRHRLSAARRTTRRSPPTTPRNSTKRSARPACTPHRVLPGAHSRGPGNPSYDAAADERHWAAMTETARRSTSPAKQTQNRIKTRPVCAILLSAAGAATSIPMMIQPTPVAVRPASYASSCVRGSAWTHFPQGKALHRRGQCSVLGAAESQRVAEQ